MFSFWGVITAATMLGGAPVVAGLWIRERSRSRSRNRRGECAFCGVAWSSTHGSDPYLIHGRLVCESCAAVARRRMPWHFGLLGVAAAVATGFALAGGASALLILLPAGSTAIMTIAAVAIMKAANHDAQRRIASGRYPDIDTVVQRTMTNELGRLSGPGANTRL